MNLFKPHRDALRQMLLWSPFLLTRKISHRELKQFTNKKCGSRTCPVNQGAILIPAKLASSDDLCIQRTEVIFRKKVRTVLCFIQWGARKSHAPHTDPQINGCGEKNSYLEMIARFQLKPEEWLCETGPPLFCRSCCKWCRSQREGCSPSETWGFWETSLKYLAWKSLKPGGEMQC